MGNTCSRSGSQVIADTDRVYTHTTYQEQLRRSHIARGRWSVPGFEGSVDLDTLVDAPSPPARKGTLRVSQDDSLVQETSKPTSRTKDRSSDRNHQRDSTFEDKRNGSFFNRKKKGKNGVSKRNSSKSFQRQLLFDFQLEHCDHGMHRNDSVEILDFDSDLILGSPMDSPSVIHARWGEPVEDPEQMNTCMDFVPNPFKLGFCVNCQKQHEVTSTGDVVFTKEFKKICRPAVSKTAASALDNPAALNNILLAENERESDVDLALILRQRRDILLRLKRMEQDRKVAKPTSKRALSRSMYVRECNDATTKLRMLATSRVHETGATITPESSVATRTTASRSFCASKVMRKHDGRLESVWL
uniref:Uncharacterized protein AlNc14C46G3733 n=1 Tax=Albugo laibachii Nc14 TaxID=890382 RepID=F0WAK9_9STRA|nr:conserved hypothetical protein [Albugo laibachii Nc14]|eukprot:CCA18180.1 conserved hypothetical protein [Albugo laibachii Nc14]